ncbi:MAG: class I adenylate-forming enzyme family protein [Nitriliruptoraceae bacterium]
MARPPQQASIDRPWVRRYPPGVPPTYRMPDVALPRLLDDAVRDFPEQPALSADGVALTYAALRDRTVDVTALLRHLGVDEGDRVLVATGTTLTTPVVLLALWRLGAVAVPLPPGRDRARRAARAVELADAADVAGVVATRERLSELTAAGLAVAWALDSSDEGWLAPRRRFTPPRPRRRRGGDATVRALGAAIREVASAPVTRHGAAVAPERAALLVPRWRGGERRAIVLSHANLVASTFQTRLWVPDVQAGRERVVVCGDLLALGPLVLGWLAGLLAAASVELVATEDAERLPRTIAHQAATLAILEPTAVAALLDRDGGRKDLSSLRVVLATGAPLDPELARDLERRTGGARVREGFGVSEAGPITHAQPVYGRTIPGTMGLPVTDTIAIVVDPDDPGRLVPPGTVGRLALAGPQVAAGYLDDEAATAERFVDGWLLTEDLVTVDEEGVFTHVGRADEVLALPDGTLVSPRRVEVVLAQQPGVRRAGVTTDATTGALVAAVQPRRRPRPDPDQLRATCQEQLEVQLVPARVVLVDELPENDAGEVARDALRELLAER